MTNAIKSKAGLKGQTYLVQSVSMSYFSPSGKARLAAKTSYHVYADMVDGMESERSRFHFKSKAEALKYFKSL